MTMTGPGRNVARAPVTGVIVLVLILLGSGVVVAPVPPGHSGYAAPSAPSVGTRPFPPDRPPSVRPTAGTTYYVDFAQGSDDNPGTSPSSPWKHAPGDPDATGVVANASLNPGARVLFKGGVVYYGTIVLQWSGSAGLPVTYDGNSAGDFGIGPAIVDGSGQALGPLAFQYGFVGAETWNGAEDVGVSYVTIDNFAIRDLRYIWNDTGGGWNNGPVGVDIGGTGSNVTVENCWIHDVQPIALAVNNNSMVMGSLNPWTSVHVTAITFTDSNVTLAPYAGTPGHLARYKIYVGWGSDDYTIASAYLGGYSELTNTLEVYQDLNLTMPGWNTAYGDPVGAASAYGYSIFNMTEGPMYGKQSADISVATHPDTQLLNNTLSDAGTGIDLSEDNDTLLDGNDISSVSWGIAGGSGEVPAAALVNVTISHNRIHDFYPYVRYGYWSGWHGDGVYLFAGSNSYAPIRNLLLEGNEFYGYVPEATALFYCEDADYLNVTIFDNVFAASGTWMIRISADPGSILAGVRVFNNDFVMAPLDQSPAVLFQGAVTNVSLRNNAVWIPSGWGAVFSFDPAGLDPLGSDYNLLGSDYAYAGDVGYNGSEYTIAQWVASNFSFAHDQHSEIDVAPGFANFPAFEAYLGGGSTNNVSLPVEDPPVNPHVNATFRVGDYVEYDYDGVVRTVTAVGTGSPQSWVAFSPALMFPPSGGDFLTDWRADSNFTFNLHPEPGSPLIGSGENLASEVPAVDATGEARSLTGTWDIGAYDYSSLGPTTLSSVIVQPATVDTAPSIRTTLTAIAVCTSACPVGVNFRWSFPSSLGVLNTTIGPSITLIAGDTSGTGVIYLNATLNGVTRTAIPVDVTVSERNGGGASAGQGVTPTELALAGLAAIGAGMAATVWVYRRRERARRSDRFPDRSGENVPGPSTRR
jgi:hypothetical protein